MSDLSDTVLAFASGSYQVSRVTQGGYVKGREGAKTLTQFTTELSIQPMSGRELQRLPEGMRTKQMLVVFSPVELIAQAPGFEADIVDYKGDQFEVSSVEDWSDFGSYWRAVLVKVGR